MVGPKRVEPATPWRCPPQVPFFLLLTNQNSWESIGSENMAIEKHALHSLTNIFDEKTKIHGEQIFKELTPFVKRRWNGLKTDLF